MARSAQAGRASAGFAPVAHARIHTLILGSLPSRKSLQLGQYYGHPQNAFWRIMGALFGAGPELPYADRVRRLLGANIGIWDVLRSSVRPGSMDAHIDARSAMPNDFDGFLDAHRAVRRICFNGRKAAELFAKLPALTDRQRLAAIELIDLPSTSPAYAAMPFEEKLERWSIIEKAPARAGGIRQAAR